MLQYIGARYVPIFYQNSLDPTSSLWEANVTYEPMTWVELSNGHMYISKKEVPANIGTPASNPEYWLEAGQYNAYIQNLQNQIDQINNVNLPALVDADTDINNKLIELREREDWANRRIVIIGDSYADENTEFAQLILGLHVFKSVNIIAGGGWGFTGKDGAQSGTIGPTLEWKTHFKDFIDNTSQDYLDEISDVYIIGGFNDHYSTEATILSHMSDFFTYAKGALPNVNYHVGLCAWANDGTITTPNETALGGVIRLAISTTVLKAYKQCVRYGAEFMGDFIWELHDYANGYDYSNYHPSSTASIKIANAVLAAIFGYDYDAEETVTYAIRENGNEKTLGAIRRCGNEIKFMPNNHQPIAETATTNYIAGQSFPLTSVQRSLVNNYVAGRNNINNSFKALARINVSGNPYYQCDVSMREDASWEITRAPFNITSGQEIAIIFQSSTLSILDC